MMADKKCPYCRGELCLNHSFICPYQHYFFIDEQAKTKESRCLKKPTEPYEEYKFEYEPGEEEELQ